MCLHRQMSSPPLLVQRRHTDCGNDGSAERRNVLSLSNKASHIQSWEEIQQKKSTMCQKFQIQTEGKVLFNNFYIYRLL